MTDTNELSRLIATAKDRGAIVTIEPAADGYEFGTVQVVGLTGIGPHPMTPIRAAERLREALNA